MGSYLNPGSKGFVESLNSEIYVDKSLPIALKKRSKVVSEGNITFPEKKMKEFLHAEETMKEAVLPYLTTLPRRIRRS